LHVEAHGHIQTAFLCGKKRLSFLVGRGAVCVAGIELFLCFIYASHYLKRSLREKKRRIVQSVVGYLEFLATTSMFTSAVAALQGPGLVCEGLRLISYYLGNV
jgi:hypothetical protein